MQRLWSLLNVEELETPMISEDLLKQVQQGVPLRKVESIEPISVPVTEDKLEKKEEEKVQSNENVVQGIQLL